jgi:TolB-like protein
MSDDPGNEFFSDGISEELLNLLAKIPELHVTARTSSFAFKDQSLEIPEIAKRLNVAHVLEGSVRKAGDQVRITAQLTKAEDGYHLWSETFDRTLEDIFAIQDEIAAAVVDALKVTLLGEAPTVKQLDPKAYALYLQAQYLHARGTDDGMKQSTAMLEEVLALAPEYARAWRALSRNYGQQVRRQLMPREEGLALSREAINRALAIDPFYSEAHSTLGYQTLVSGDLKAAAHHFSRAMSLEPTNEIVLNNVNGLIYTLGRLDQGHALDKYLAQKDPLSPIDQSNLALSYLWLGLPEEVIATVNTVLLLSPERPYTHLLLARALLLKGENEAALQAIQEETGENHRLEGLVMVHHALGQKTESDAALTELIGKFANNRPYHIAGLFAYRAEADRAFEWLDKAATLDPSEGLWYLHDLLFTNIHGDPRWLPFLESIGMSPTQLAAIEFEVTLPK